MRRRVVFITLAVAIAALSAAVTLQAQLDRRDTKPERQQQGEAANERSEETQPAPPSGDGVPEYEHGSEQIQREPDHQDLASLFPETIIRQVPSAGKAVALTFDDGPDDRFTPQILDRLLEHNVKATFFITGIMAEQHPDVLRRIVAEGHALGNHTYHHRKLSSQAAADVREDIRRNQDLLERFYPEVGKLFRPPYSDMTIENVVTIRDEGYTIILWTIDSLDWAGLDADEILANTLPEVTGGSIILFHSNGGPDLSGTVAALPKLIESLRSQGYTFATLPEMLQTIPVGNSPSSPPGTTDHPAQQPNREATRSLRQ